MKINVHSHVMPAGTEGSAGDEVGPFFATGDDGFTLHFGPYARKGLTTVEMQKAAAEVGMAEASRRWLQRYSDPTLRLAEMDAKGIDKMGVTMSPIIYGYWLDEEAGVRHARLQNDGLARYCAADPDRLFFMATVPAQHPGHAAEEVHRAVGQLGARAVNIAGSVLGDMELDDPRLDPFWLAVVEADVPVFVHPSLHANSRETGLDRWAPILGYPYQETIAVATLIYGGVLDRHPSLHFSITHGGGFVPYQFGRLEAFSHAYGMCHAERPLREYLDHFSFDLLVHDGAARQYLVDWATPARIVVGDNYEGIDSADGFAMLDELRLSAADRARISSQNAIDIFRL